MWLQGPMSRASCEDAGTSFRRDRRVCGRCDVEAIAVACVVARGCVDALEVGVKSTGVVYE